MISANQAAHMASYKGNRLQIQVAKHDQWETYQPRIGADMVPPTPCWLLITIPKGSGKTQLAIGLTDDSLRKFAGTSIRLFALSSLLLAVTAVFIITHHAQAKTAVALTVTTVNDTLDDADGQCSLREAIIAANNNTPSGAAAGECPAGSDSETSAMQMVSCCRRLRGLLHHLSLHHLSLHELSLHELSLHEHDIACVQAGVHNPRFVGEFVDRFDATRPVIVVPRTKVIADNNAASR